MSVTYAEQLDILPLFKAWCRASGSDFYTLTQGRVTEILAPSGADQTLASMIFHANSETKHVTADDTSVTLTCKCYGSDASLASSRTVARALRKLVHGNRRTDATYGKIFMAYVTNTVQGIPDLKTSWPITIVTIELRAETP